MSQSVTLVLILPYLESKPSILFDRRAKRGWCSNMSVRYVVVIQLLSMIEHLYLNGVWLGVDLRKNASKPRACKRLVYIFKNCTLNSQHNMEDSCIPKFHILQITHIRTIQCHYTCIDYLQQLPNPKFTNFHPKMPKCISELRIQHTCNSCNHH